MPCEVEMDEDAKIYMEVKRQMLEREKVNYVKKKDREKGDGRRR